MWMAELTAEADQEVRQTFLTVTDSVGKVVRRLAVAGSRGIHRVALNLRGIAGSAPVVGPSSRRGEEAATDESQSSAAAMAGDSFLVLGVYKVSLSRRSGGALTSLGAEQTPSLRLLFRWERC